VLLYSLILFGVSLLPLAIRMSGWLYLAAACVLGAIFIGYAIALYVRYSERLASRAFRYSIVFLALPFAALLVDHYLVHEFVNIIPG
jgi:protoheme IX farnesyltransferase